MIHLDTCFLITALVRGSPQDATLRRWLKQGEQLVMCTIAWSEFLCGPVTTPQVDLAMRLVPLRQSFDEAQAALAAELFNTTGRRRGSLVDCMIAAAALSAAAPVATTNVDDFERYASQGLLLVGAGH